MQYDVFISYKAEEFAEANWVRENLEGNGISCWMAPMSIAGGCSYAEEISKAISQCRFLVLMLSAKSQQSKWISKELDLALKNDKKILPFMIEECPLTAEYQFYLPNVQYYCAYQNKTQALKKLIADISLEKGTVGVKPTIVAKRPQVSKKSLQRGCLIAILGFVCVAFLICACVMIPLWKELFSETPADTQIGGITTGQNQNGDNSVHGDPTGSVPDHTEPAADPTDPVEEPTQPSQSTPTQPPQTQTNDTKQTAAAMEFDQQTTVVLGEESNHWYKFTTDSNIRVYRISAAPYTEKLGSNSFSFNVLLFNHSGMRLNQMTLSQNSSTSFWDLLLEPETEYYLKVETDFWASYSEGSCLLSVSPRPSDTGTSMEDATEVFLGQQNAFYLNANIADWLVFRPTESGRYKLTIHNIDVGERIEIRSCDQSGYSLGSTSAANEDNRTFIFSVAVPNEAYFSVKPYNVTPIEGGTYIIIIEKNDF